MRFDMTSPCGKCPFRKDVAGYLTVERVTEIEESLPRGTFACHATLDYSRCEDGASEPTETKQTAHCVGALILCEKSDEPTQMMRIAERLNSDGKGYDRRRFTDATKALIFDSWDEMRSHMRGRRQRARKRAGSKR